MWRSKTLKGSRDSRRGRFEGSDMRIVRSLAVLLAALLLAGALAEPVSGENPVDMASEEVLRLEQRLSALG